MKFKSPLSNQMFDELMKVANRQHRDMVKRARGRYEYLALASAFMFDCHAKALDAAARLDMNADLLYAQIESLANLANEDDGGATH